MEQINNKDRKVFILRTRQIDSYFIGKLYKESGCKEWSVICISYSGGRPPILDLLDYKTKTKSEMLKKIKRFKLKYNLISTK